MSRPFEVVFQNSHGREGDLTRVTEDGGHAGGRGRVGVSRIGVANGNVAILAIDGFTIHCGVGATWRGVTVVVIGVIVVVVHVIVPSGIIIIGVIVIALGVGGIGGGLVIIGVILVVTTVAAAVVIVTVVEGPRGVGGRAEDGAGLGRLAITGTTETRGQAGTHHPVPTTTLLVRRDGRRDGQLPIHTRNTGLARIGPTHMMCCGHVPRIAGRWAMAGHGSARHTTTVPA